MSLDLLLAPDPSAQVPLGPRNIQTPSVGKGSGGKDAKEAVQLAGHRVVRGGRARAISRCCRGERRQRHVRKHDAGWVEPGAGRGLQVRLEFRAVRSRRDSNVQLLCVGRVRVGEPQSFIPAVYDASGALVATGDPVSVAAGSPGLLAPVGADPDRPRCHACRHVCAGSRGRDLPATSLCRDRTSTREPASSTPTRTPMPVEPVRRRWSHGAVVLVLRRLHDGSRTGHGVVDVWAEPARGAYCAVTGDSNPFTGAAIPAGTFLNLGLGQPAFDSHYKGAVPAFYVQGVGLTCDPPPAGLAAAGDSSTRSARSSGECPRSRRDLPVLQAAVSHRRPGAASITAAPGRHQSRPRGRSWPFVGIRNGQQARR